MLYKTREADSVWLVSASELQLEEPEEILGQGTFGEVIKAEFRGTPVAVKRVLARKMTGVGASGQFSSLRKEIRKNLIKEMRILSRLRHPCVITIMGAVIESKMDPLIVLEYMDLGSLHSLIHNQTIELEAEMFVCILLDVVQGIRFLHSSKPQVIHGDLKSHNVLVDSKFRAKVADFGLSRVKSVHQRDKMVKGTGTIAWMAPELLRGGNNTPESDVYSFGVILNEVFSRQDPYQGEDMRVVVLEVMDLGREEEKRPAIDERCPADIKGLIRDCWNKEAELRPPC
ncbi:hypothetical protein GUITHDRAFT_75727 [Guillardia theta CCMP2712]|uniref:Protein kinase domain-containing protein n=1 Tax=Guillardia theta (strain CCMP2712) TaxID=905079 RepID=L1IV77_GUITC|nr:hypothetical protein GUITHDRAFT_75727 [Guillardia theta CCMP2712]EKX40166.1 hypothetical protein GUITHDRAFT_75727 [Guillardia theta CCMP2712]|eukprot:XP_005827146.1 hypothetical protein GUITHDRAFT_75727 [Guillardia theta CCMP2712]